MRKIQTKEKEMRLLNLFDGIGGFALAAEWMGWENVGSVEIDPFCRQVLDYWFDYECTWTDIKAADFVRLRGRIDIITGGFPCQPFSNAGKQRGKDDDRYLWPEMLRAIREVRPRWVVGENVRGLLSNTGGMVFEQVCADMEALGYEVQPFVVPACAVDAPHRRDRVWIVARLAADTPRNGDSGTSSEAGATPRRPDGNEAEQPLQRGGFRAAPDTDGHRLGKRKGEQKPFARSRGETHDSDGGKDGFAADTDRDGGQAQAERESGKGCEAAHQPESLQHPDALSYPVGDRHSAPGAGEGAEGGRGKLLLQPEERGDKAERADGLPRLPRTAPDTECNRRNERDEDIQPEQPKREGSVSDGMQRDASIPGCQPGKGRFGIPPDWSCFPTQSPVCNGDDGVSLGLAGIPFPKWRRESLKCLGNSIVPQVALEIFKAIEKTEKELNNH